MKIILKAITSLRGARRSGRPIPANTVPAAVLWYRAVSGRYCRIARFLVISTLAVLLSSCSHDMGAQSYPKAVKGVLDLAKWDFGVRGNVPLDGEWEFYPGWFISPGTGNREAVGIQPGYINVPSSWTRHPVGGGTMGSHGYATYRLTLRFSGMQSDLALYFHEIRTSYRAFLNGKLVAGNGTVGSSTEESVPQYLPMVREIRDMSEILELVVHVSNYHTVQGGMLQSVIIGESTSVQRTRGNNISFQVFLLGSLLIMGLFLLGMFFIQKVDKSPLYLGLFCLLIAMRPLVTGEYFLIYWFPRFSWSLMLKLEYLTLYAGLPLVMTFMLTIFPLDISKRLTRIVQAVGAAGSLLVLFTPVWIYNHSILFYEIFTLAIGTYILAIVIIASARKREGAAIFLFGTFILMITVTNEILYDMRIIDTGPFFPFGVFIFVLSQSFLLSLRFAKAYERERVLALIEQELQLAEKMQRSTLPTETPRVPGIECSTLYIPSAYVGGDFYDFHVVDEKRIGILITDISGHGVPSAMITSMIKVIFYMLRDLAGKPESLLVEMNRILAGIIENNFVTAGYLFIDLEEGKARYARGGHEPLLVQHGGNSWITEYLPAGRMLGTRSDIHCSAVEFAAGPGDRLVLYTDGVTELFNARREMFGRAAFGTALMNKRGMDQQSFIASMETELRTWAASRESFNDDVTIVVVDIL